MGGLLIRSACDIGASRRLGWVSLVRHCVYLGAPHYGAPLERGVQALTSGLRLLPETRVLASLIDVRRGITDLRWGYVSEEPVRDPMGPRRDRASDLALLPTPGTTWWPPASATPPATR